MKRAFSTACAALLLVVLSSVSLWAQATAQISGTVKDQSGAVLPGVEITATQTDTGVARTTVTNETGSYVLPNLPLGPYRLEAGLPGFRTFVQTGIVLLVNANSRPSGAHAGSESSKSPEVICATLCVATSSTKRWVRRRSRKPTPEWSQV